MSFSQCSRFIQNNDIYFAHLFQSHCIFNQNMLAGSFTYTHHQRSRCSKPQSTWTSNDKNRNSRQNTIRDIFTTTNGNPQYKCQNGNAQYDRYKNPRNTIDNALHGSFAALCFLHHSDNTGKHGFTAYLCGTNDKWATLVDRSRQYFITFLLFYRNRFTANHTLIDIRVAFGKLTVHRYLFSRAYNHQITYLEFLNQDLLLHSIAQNASRFWLHSHQLTNGCWGISFGTFFHQLSGKNESDNHRRSLIIDMRFQSAVIPEFGEESVEQTEQKSNGSTKRNQSIHIAPS